MKCIQNLVVEEVVVVVVVAPPSYTGIAQVPALLVAITSTLAHLHHTLY